MAILNYKKSRACFQRDSDLSLLASSSIITGGKRLHLFVKWFGIVWLLFACNFGITLFFSFNGNIQNPEVSMFPPLIKDAAWLIFLVLAIFCFRSKPPHQLFIIGILTGITLLSTLVCVAIVSNDLSIFSQPIRTIKNAALYIFCPIILVSFTQYRFDNIVRILMAALFVTLLVSISLYFLVEANFKNSELRMFGSTGNPNAASFLAAILFLLVSAYFNKIKPLSRGVCLLVTFLALYLSASYLYLFVVMAVMVYYLAVDVQKLKFKKVVQYLLELIFYSIVAWQLSVFLINLADYPMVPLAQRLNSAVVTMETSSLESSDSIRVRSEAITEFYSSNSGVFGSSVFKQADSAFMTFLSNFGIFGFLTLILPYGAALFFFISQKHYLNPFNTPTHIFVVTMGIFFISGLLHYQISNFPTNLIISTLFLCSFKEVLLGKGCKKMG